MASNSVIKATGSIAFAADSFKRSRVIYIKTSIQSSKVII